MAKRNTPAMEKIAKQKAKAIEKNHGKEVKSSPGKEAWKRLLRNKLAVVGMVILVLMLVIALLAPIISPYDYSEMDLMNAQAAPGNGHLMGTDKYGRDIFSRIMNGARVSLPVGFICVALAFGIGGFFGALAAYYGGNVDNVIMRVLDVFQSVPPMLMAIAVAATLGNGARNLVIAIVVSSIPARARVVRAAILTVKRNDYIESAKSMGASSKRQMLKYMLPNALGPILTAITFAVATAILTVSSLAYIGLGIVEPTPEWGAMLSSGKELLRTAPHVLIFPGIAIMITVLALNLFGDGLRDALDPRLK